MLSLSILFKSFLLISCLYSIHITDTFTGFTIQNSDTAARIYIPPSFSLRRASRSITKVYFPVCFSLPTVVWWNCCPQRLDQSPALVVLSLCSLFYLLLLGQRSHSRSIKLWLLILTVLHSLCVRVKWLPRSRLCISSLSLDITPTPARHGLSLSLFQCA